MKIAAIDTNGKAMNNRRLICTCAQLKAYFKNIMKVKNSINIFFISFLTAYLAPVQAASYSLYDLGSLGRSLGLASAINNNGEVAGYSTNAFPFVHATVWKPNSNSLIDLGVSTPSNTNSWAFGINDSGQVAGFTSTRAANLSEIPHATLWQSQSTTPIYLDTFGGSYSNAFGINNKGQIVGYAFTANNASNRATLWQSGTLLPIDLGEGTAKGINDIGQIVGATNHATLWQPGSTVGIDLGTLGGSYSTANAINNLGEAVGGAYTNGNANYHAALWLNDSTTAIDLGTLGGSSSLANSINVSGLIVGNSRLLGDTAEHAALWFKDSGNVIDLNTLVALSNFYLRDALDINDKGQIVALGSNNRAYLLTPDNILTVDEPNIIWLFGFAFLLTNIRKAG